MNVFSVQVVGTPPFAVRLKYGRLVVPLSPNYAAAVWQLEDDTRLTFESLKPGKDRAMASAIGMLRDSLEEKLEVSLSGYPLVVVIRKCTERETASSTVRVVVGNQDVALLYSQTAPPLSLLLRLSKHMSGELGWPQPLLLVEGAIILCPKVFSKPVKDEAVCVISEEEARDVDERGIELANAALSLAAVLYSHGYRESTRNFWVSGAVPQSSIVPGFAFATSSDTVTLWGEVPAEVLSRLESEFTGSAFSQVASGEAGCGLSGKRFRFVKQALGKHQQAMSLLHMRGTVASMVKRLGLFVAVGCWSSNVQIFLQVRPLDTVQMGFASTAATDAAKHPLRMSMGSQIDDNVLDPLAAMFNPEVSLVLANDISGLVSDVGFRSWPVNVLPFAKVLERANLADLKVTRDKADNWVANLATASKWKEIAWKGGRGCRMLKVPPPVFCFVHICWFANEFHFRN